MRILNVRGNRNGERALIKRICWLAMAFVPALAHAANFPISAGASTATIQSTVNSAAAAGGGNTVTFAAGNYTITSQINIPCPASPLTITGPTPTGAPTNLSTAAGATWPISPTAVISGNLGVQWGFSLSSCSTAVTIQYLEWNGGSPTGGGGGFLYIPQNTNNPTIWWNFIHGNGATQIGSHEQDSLIWMDGPLGGSPRDANVTIKWNRFGQVNSNDCAALMNVQGGTFGGGGGCVADPGHCSTGGYVSGGTQTCWYQGCQSEKDGGGYCSAVGIHVNTDNFNFSNNMVSHQEQGMKFFEGTQSAPGIYTPTNLTVQNNDFVQAHRIILEAQQGSPGPWTIKNNDEHDMALFGGVSWGFSVPQGGPNNVTNNVMVLNNNNNAKDKYGFGTVGAEGIEQWGNGSLSANNLLQGYWSGGVNYGFGSGMAINNNTISLIGSSGCIQNEEGTSPPPSQSGNVCNQSPATVTSIAPTFSPSSGAAPLTVTLNDTGYTSGPVPQGNTGIWYTTDGSNPVPGSGTAKYVPSGGTFNMATSGTVKAVGMWGALNQPASYPSGFGFVPSGIVSATFSGGGTPTVSAPVLSPAGGSFTGSQTISMSTTTPGAGIWYTTDGSTPTLPPGGVPQGTSSSYTPMCQPYTQPPIGGLKNITAFGASTGGTAAANTTAIQSACTAAGAPSSTSGIFIPAGTFETNAMTLNCNIFGQGPTSELHGATPTNEMITTSADNVVWSNWQHNVASNNSNDFVDFNLHLSGIHNGRMDTLTIVGGNSGGIFNDFTTNEVDTNNGIFNTFRDSNYHAGENSTPSGTGVTNPVVDHEYIYNNGDDGISFVSYGTGPLLVTGALAQWNNLALSTGAIDLSRGITIPGGTNATFQNNLIQNQQTNAGVYVAQEAPSSFVETSVNNVLVQYNYLLNDSGTPTFNPCILLYSASPGQPGVTNVAVNGNFISGCGASALGTFQSGGPIGNISFLNNTVTGTNGMWNTTGTSTNVQCSGNTYNGAASNAGGQCGGTNPATATGSPASYSGCVVGTARQYTGPIAISSSATVKAIAVFPGIPNSGIGSGTFTGGGTPTVATPVLTPTSQSFFTSLPVNISDTTPSSTIFYTTDGSTPTTSSPVYTGTITVASTKTIQAMATASGLLNSAIGSGTYTLSIPPLTGCTQDNATSINSMAVGGKTQQFARCSYAASGENLVCSPTADKYGDVATAWGTGGAAITVGAIGNPAGCTGALNGPGCVTGISATGGTPVNSTLTVGTHSCSPWGWTITNSPPTLLSATVTLFGGGTAVNVGSTVQACANMFYTGSITTQMCTSGTDSFGTVVSNFTSSSPANATMNSTTGMLTGVAAGTTNAGVHAGSFTPSLAVSVNTPITGVNATFSGAQLSGAQIQ